MLVKQVTDNLQLNSRTQFYFMTILVKNLKTSEDMKTGMVLKVIACVLELTDNNSV